MNICIHKIAETECLNLYIELEYAHMNIYHAQMQSSIRHSGNIIHSNKHSCNMFIISLIEIKVAEVKMDKSTYLMMNSIHNHLCRCNVPPNRRPTCSLISQQHCHPRAGHDSPGIRELAGLHIAKDIQNTAKPTQLGLSGHQGDLERLNAKLVSSLQS